MLETLLKQEIQEQGSLSLARYMALCLYHPDHGYYTTQKPFGQQGDFVTAPEISSLFGETIAFSIMANAFEKGYKNASLVEFGGGLGTLMVMCCVYCIRLATRPQHTWWKPVLY